MSEAFRAIVQSLLGSLGGAPEQERALNELRPALVQLRKQYRDSSPPKFGSLAARQAYSLAYHPYHSHMALEVLRRCAPVLAFSGAEVSMTVHGAGPAPEVVAFAQLLAETERFENVKKLVVDLVDKEPGWEELRSDSVVEPVRRLWPGTLELRHHTLDLNTEAGVRWSLEASKGRDLVIVQAALSELKMAGGSDSFLDHLIEGFSAQTLLLTNDFTGLKGLSDRTEMLDNRADLVVVQAWSDQLPTPTAPSLLLSHLYKQADNLRERRKVRFTSRVYARPGWRRPVLDGSRDEPFLFPEQSDLLERITTFVTKRTADVFVLTGVAGTGKTLLIRRLVQRVEETGRFVELLAPTALCARRLARHTERPTATLHGALYHRPRRVSRDKRDKGASPQYHFQLRTEGVRDRLIVVDEASLVGDQAPDTVDATEAEVLFGNGKLLSELLEVAGRDAAQLIFVGDRYQLPPFGEKTSQALDPASLKNRQLKCEAGELTVVRRQKEGSAIPELADQVRRSIDSGGPLPPKPAEEGRGIHFEAPPWLLEGLADKTALAVTSTNADAIRWHQEVRKALGRGRERPEAGDRLVLSSNNYRTGLLNGEELEVVAFCGEERIAFQGESVDIGRLRLRHTSVAGTTADFEAWVVLDLLLKRGRDIEERVGRVLWMDCVRRIEESGTRRTDKELFESLVEHDPYFGALRCRYAYASTVHRAQGGEWDRVVLDLREANSRAAYTALTRARNAVWLDHWPGGRAGRNDLFRRFVDFTLSCATRRFVGLKDVEEAELKPFEYPDENKTAIRLALNDKTVVINLWSTFKCKVQNWPEQGAGAELQRELDQWVQENRKVERSSPHPALAPSLDRLKSEATLSGHTITAHQVANYQVAIVIERGGHQGEIVFWHKADGSLSREAREKGDEELVDLLRRLVERLP